MNYFEFESGLSDPLVKSRLKNALPFWESELQAPREVLEIISKGYEIHFVEPPPRMHFKNNRSALENAPFVREAIEELLKFDLIKECSEPPFVISPLSVAENNSKKRLILDLSKLNDFIKLERIVLEDARDFYNLAQNIKYVASFDLKQAYHQVIKFQENLFSFVLLFYVLCLIVFKRIFWNFITWCYRLMYVKIATLTLVFHGNSMGSQNILSLL